jgi:hypothetical protein
MVPVAAVRLRQTGCEKVFKNVLSQLVFVGTKISPLCVHASGGHSLRCVTLTALYYVRARGLSTRFRRVTGVAFAHEMNAMVGLKLSFSMLLSL